VAQAECPKDCDELHNVRRAAKLSGFSRSQLYRLMDAGKLAFEEVRGGRAIRHSKLKQCERTRRPTK
jgi:predicted DNA-binding transcriptional regulator AlpA